MAILNLQKNGKNTGKLEVKNLNDTDAELIIYGEIISDSWEASQFEDIAPMDVKYLLEEAGKRDLSIRINSPGGNIFAGIAIYNLLKSYSGKKKVFIEGVAASISSVIAMAGDEIHIPLNSFLMIHKAWGKCIGNADDLRETADLYDRLDETMVRIYETKFHKDIDILSLMKNETWIGGGDAKMYLQALEMPEVEIAACLEGEEIKGYKIPETLKRTDIRAKETNEKKEIEKARLELKLKTI